MKSPPNTTPVAQGFRMPAEWEPHCATWLCWPHHRDDWPGRFEAIPPVFARMASELQRGERVRIIVRDADEEARARRLLAKEAADTERILFYRAPTNRSWARDSLPTFVVADDEGTRRRAAIKWRFNGWARYPDFELDDAAGEKVAGWLGVEQWLPESLIDARPSRIVLEGGAIDVDGDGTALASEPCLLSGSRARNPQLDRGAMERVLYDHLGIRKVIWFDSEIAGDDTSGHVDSFVRFVAPGRVLLCEEANPGDANRAALSSARESLSRNPDARGREIEIVPLPSPRAIFLEGERLPASYANFYIGNEVVLVPTFDDPRDGVALATLGELFPSRRVVGVRAVDLVLGLGTIHCSTQQEPAMGSSEKETP